MDRILRYSEGGIPQCQGQIQRNARHIFGEHSFGQLGTLLSPISEIKQVKEAPFPKPGFFSGILPCQRKVIG